MKPRVILKTHSAVRRPGIFSVLVSKCTSPTRTSHQETIVKRLADKFRDVDPENLAGARFGKRGAAFHAVWMARPNQLGLLTPNLFWSWKGQVIHHVGCRESTNNVEAMLDLGPEELLILLKYYLEGDGAIILAIARRLLEKGVLFEHDLTHTHLIDELLSRIWQEYLYLTSNIRDRTQLRNQMQRTSYDPTTRGHKIFPHLMPLIDFRLIIEDFEPSGRSFRATELDGKKPLQSLVEDIANPADLEEVIQSGNLPNVIAKAYYSEEIKTLKSESLRDYETTVLRIYKKFSESGLTICPLNSISDAAFAIVLQRDKVVLTRQSIDEILRKVQERNPREVAFHVNKQGFPEYVVISDALISRELDPEEK